MMTIKWNCIRSIPHLIIGGLLFPLGLIAAPLPDSHPDNHQSSSDILNLSLEELMNIEVTGLSKKTDNLSKVPAAAFVITSSDIMSSTATTIPELLKMVPGMAVSQVNGGRYAVSSRGFNALFSNKLLVLIDGKDGYSSLFSSVNWDALDLPLQNIERIEVFRGPAGTIYGSNAVNGMINIVTKRSDNQPRFQSSTKIGDLERVTTDLISSADLSENTSLKVSGRFRNQKRLSLDVDQSETDTGYDGYHFSMRMDSKVSEATSSLTTARMYKTRLGDVFSFPNPFTEGGYDNPSRMDTQYGFYIAEDIRTEVSDSLTLAGQFGFDREDREFLDLKTTLNTVTGEFRAIWDITEDLNFIGGTAYRLVTTDLNDGPIANLAFSSDDPSFTVAGAFSQLEYAPTSAVKISGGMRLEHNDYTKFEVMPNARIAYFPTDEQTLWGSIGRATRLPSITDRHGSAERYFETPDGETGLPILIDFSGGSNLKAENLIAYEVGHRASLSEDMTTSLEGFYYDYSDVQGIDPSGSPSVITDPAPTLVIPAEFGYNGKGEAWGVEAGLKYSLSKSTFFYTSYSYLDFRLSRLGEIGSVFNTAGSAPENKVTLHFHTSPLQSTYLDLFYYFYDDLAAFTNVDSYHAMDLKIRYDLSSNFRIALVGRNLLDNGRTEWGFDDVIRVIGGEVPRSYYGMVEFVFD